MIVNILSAYITCVGRLENPCMHYVYGFGHIDAHSNITQVTKCDEMP